MLAWEFLKVDVFSLTLVHRTNSSDDDYKSNKSGMVSCSPCRLHAKLVHLHLSQPLVKQPFL
jgi:hypothetical protein